MKKLLSAVITGAVMIVSANGFAQEAGKQAVKKEEHHEKMMKREEHKKAKKVNETKQQSEGEDNYGTPDEKDFTSGGDDDS